MKITNIETFELEIPFSIGVDYKKELSSDFPIQKQVFDSCIVKVETDNGIVGWGDAFAYGCRRAVAECINHMIIPKVLGKNPLDAQNINKDLQKQLHLFGRYGITIFGISAIDIALWDIIGKFNEKPIYKVLGKTRNDNLKGYSSLFRYGDKDIVKDRVKKSIKDGYKYIKLHEITEEEVKASREVAGENIEIMVDTNCPWSLEEAIMMAKKFLKYNIYWLEEPLNPPEDFDGLSIIRKETGISIATGENACTSFQFKHMIEKNAVDFVQPSVTKVGGITEFLNIATLCKNKNVSLMPHSPYFGPGFLATLQLSSYLPNPGMIERFYVTPEAYLYPNEIFNPLNGFFSCPDGCGLGKEPDEYVLKDFKVN